MDDRSKLIRTLKEMWADKGCLFMGCLMLTIVVVAIYSILSPTEIKYREERAKIERREDAQRAAMCGFDYKTFKFRNHSYIVFTINEGKYSFNCPVVHDPDCLCWMDSFYGEPLLPPTN